MKNVLWELKFTHKKYLNVICCNSSQVTGITVPCHHVSSSSLSFMSFASQVSSAQLGRSIKCERYLIPDRIKEEGSWIELERMCPPSYCHLLCTAQSNKKLKLN